MIQPERVVQEGDLPKCTFDATVENNSRERHGETKGNRKRKEKPFRHMEINWVSQFTFPGIVFRRGLHFLPLLLVGQG